MPYSFSILDKANYLLFTTEGKAESHTDATAYIKSIITHARKLERKRLLLDETAVVMHLDTHDAIQLAEGLSDAEIPGMGIRVAIVCAPDNCQILRTIETALRNRSINCRTFVDMDEAKIWLMK